MTTTVDQITQRRRGTGLIAHDPALSAGGYTPLAPHARRTPPGVNTTTGVTS